MRTLYAPIGSTMNVLISGAGVAGPALAVAFQPYGHRVVVVERAAALRTGGQAVDFRGEVHRRVLVDLGLWDPIHDHRTTPYPLLFIDAAGRTKVRIPAVLTAGDVEIVRGDLCHLLYAKTRARAEYRFGDSIAALDADGDEVEVTFASGARERFDLVVGADGLHSGVRAIAFGPESGFVRNHGYCLAACTVDRVIDVGSACVSYAEPGRSATVSPDASGSLRLSFMFTSPPPDRQWDGAAIRTWIAARFAGAGWETPRLVRALDDTKDLYVDSVSTVHVDRYSQSRVVLLGDAAWGGTIGGQGTGLSVVGAWVLARELAAAGTDVGAGLRAFEARMRPYAAGCQKNAAHVGTFHAPKTRLGLAARNAFYRAMTSRLLAKQFEKMVKASASAFELTND